MLRPRDFSCSKILAIVFLYCLPLVEFAPVSSNTQALIYLSRFGYISTSSANLSSGTLVDGESWNRAISEFQSFAGLKITGELNNDTIQKMSLPRCGVKDKIYIGSNSRSKRYVLQGSSWADKDLKYRIIKYPRTSKLRKEKIDEEIQKAFEVWATHTDLTFTQVKRGQVHIEIKFEKSEHGDGDPFDGKGGILGHAYFPRYGGDIHFDDDEDWTSKSFRGTNLFLTAAHEFGHSLGLHHSDVKEALMAPFYKGYNPSFQLDMDDIDAIQKIYGKKSPQNIPNTRPVNVLKPPKIPNAKLCSDPKIDAIFNDAKGDTFLFKGDDYYKLDQPGIAPGYPKPIASNWRELPGNIDAAFTYKDGTTYFFKGSKYWRYVGTRMDGEFPKKINKDFPGIPINVDSVFVWSGNGKIYFFKGSKYWRYDIILQPPVNPEYPRSINSKWKGVPNNIDTAFQYTDGVTYFFKNGAYYRFNDTSRRIVDVATSSVDSADLVFPRSTAYWWFGCNLDTIV